MGEGAAGAAASAAGASTCAAGAGDGVSSASNIFPDMRKNTPFTFFVLCEVLIDILYSQYRVTYRNMQSRMM